MKLSLIDLSTIQPGGDRHEAFMHSIATAKLAKDLGFTRFWVAEHHGSRAIAGRSPEVLIAAIAGKTKSIRVGSGSVLLNHYSAFKVAETFCTLNELYPGRIDLGAGRATTGRVLDFALQQDRTKLFQSDSAAQLTELVAWLENSFPSDHPFASSPIYTLSSPPALQVLGSSAWSASAAAALGLPYVFAGFINQQQAWDIISSYREGFQPNTGATRVEKPEVILAIHALCADTHQEARRQLAPVTLMYQNLSKGILDFALPSPDDAVSQLGFLPEIQPYQPRSMLLPKFLAGTPQELAPQFKAIAEDFNVSELMIQDMMSDHEARLRSVSLLGTLID